MGLFKSKSKNLALVPLFITICLDFISIGVVLPILTPLLLDPTNPILSLGATVPQRTIILGLLVSSFSIAAFFGAPILGAWSDRVGRKTVLRYTLFIAFCTYLMFAVGVSTSNLALLFVARILGGFAGSNVNTCVASMVDIVHPHKRVWYFGLVGMFSFACGYAVGPIIAGLFASPAAPFYFISLWSLMNLALNELLLEETLQHKKEGKITLLDGLTTVFKVLNYPKLKMAFLLSFLITFSFNFFDQFFQVFLAQKFMFGTPQIAQMLALLGISMALTQGVIVRLLPKRFSPVGVLLFTLPLVAVFIISVVIPRDPQDFYFILPLIAIFQGLAWPYSFALLCNLADEKSQGEVLGINTSLTGLAIGLPPLLSGFIGAFNYNLPIILGGVIAFLAWIMFLGSFLRSKKAASIPTL